jgi:hypothetical protein
MQATQLWRSRPREIARIVVGAASLALASAWESGAAITAPLLEIAEVATQRAPSGLLLRIAGAFPQGDFVQSPLEIHVLVREREGANRFVRYELAVGAFEGSASALEDGFGAEDIDAVLAASQRSVRPRVLLLAPGSLELLVPGDYEGPAEAQLFMIYRGDPLLSNPVGFDFPEQQP